MLNKIDSQKISALAGLLRMTVYVGQSLRLMVGVPEYSTYVAHMRSKHPDKPPMSYQEFFRECQATRYDGRVGRCC
jgi:uncharacterized short protein YbdD (DUF466 family)